MRKQGAGLGVGTSSILMIFVLLCLTTFATLSLVSANAEYKLTTRSAGAMADYYRADGAAEQRLAEIDGILSEKAAFAEDRSSYLAQSGEALLKLEGVACARENGALTVSWSSPVDSRRMLEAQAEILYPPESGGPRFRIVSWRMVNIGEWEEQEQLNLWTGEEAMAEIIE